jgi:glyoxalase family protein
VADGEGLLKWKRRLTDLSLVVTGPLDRHYYQSICFSDPDGALLEIATRGPGWAVDEAADRLEHEYHELPRETIIRNRDEARIASETWPEPVPEIAGHGADARHASYHGHQFGPAPHTCF